MSSGSRSASAISSTTLPPNENGMLSIPPSNSGSGQPVGSVTVTPLQPANAPLWMPTTLSHSAISVRFEQCEKAFESITVGSVNTLAKSARSISDGAETSAAVPSPLSSISHSWLSAASPPACITVEASTSGSPIMVRRRFSAPIGSEPSAP